MKLTEEKESKVVKRRSSLESGGEGGAGDANCLRRHKSLDGGGQSNLKSEENEEKEKDKKDPRLERRIRNKVSFFVQNLLLVKHAFTLNKINHESPVTVAGSPSNGDL